MREFSKPVVVVSKCITFEPLRWDGGIIASDFVEKLKPYVDFIPVCPEVGIGLGVPRDPVRIVLVDGKPRLLQPSTGLDFTDKIRIFAESFLNSLNEVDGFILKSGSPSSGFKNVKIYPKIQKSPSISKGPGFFGKAVLEKFPHLAIEDERRLLNPRIKEHFLTRLFVFASFRGVKKSGSMKELVRFQSENKYLLTVYNQKELRVLGRIVANSEKKQFDEIIKSYEIHLYNGFKRAPKVGANINVMTKAMGYFSHQLSKEEKSFFLESLEKCKAGRLPLSASLSILKAWIIRFKEEYLVNQSFLEPFPEKLVDLGTISTDSKGKNYWK